MKTSELTGALLDFWVAKVHNFTRVELREGICLASLPILVDRVAMLPFQPSINWAQGGPIIESERIGFLPATKDIKADKNYQRRTGRSFMPEPDGWVAGYRPITHIEFDWGGAQEVGPTPLIACMRVYVASKYGNEVPEVNP